jgi:hypothetical protein
MQLSLTVAHTTFLSMFRCIANHMLDGCLAGDLLVLLEDLEPVASLQNCRPHSYTN